MLQTFMDVKMHFAWMRYRLKFCMAARLQAASSHGCKAGCNFACLESSKLAFCKFGLLKSLARLQGSKLAFRAVATQGCKVFCSGCLSLSLSLFCLSHSLSLFSISLSVSPLALSQSLCISLSRSISLGVSSALCLCIFSSLSPILLSRLASLVSVL